jgi:hypothetical protein
MEETVETKPRDISSGFNKILYGGFILLGLYFLVFSKDLSQGVINIGIALAFDPFDQKQPFKERPFFQKIWLFAHVSIALGLFAYMLMSR